MLPCLCVCQLAERWDNPEGADIEEGSESSAVLGWSDWVAEGR